jgi:glyoxylase-like metal-dependent hydrolase (beta-lactamase superfamily II)
MEIIGLSAHLSMVRVEFGQLYLWRDRDELTLVDTGIVGSGPAIAEAVATLGLDTSAIRRVVITHGHEDHAARPPRSARGTAPPVCVHEADAAFVRGDARRPEPVLTEFDAALWQTIGSLGLPPAPPATVDVELHDGDELDFAGGARILGVPGHTPGSLAVYLPANRVLFTGDTVAATPAGEVVLGVFNQDEDQQLESFRRLAELDVETACFGHGEPVVGGAGAAMRESVAGHRKRAPV